MATLPGEMLGWERRGRGEEQAVEEGGGGDEAIVASAASMELPEERVRQLARQATTQSRLLGPAVPKRSSKFSHTSGAPLWEDLEEGGEGREVGLRGLGGASVNSQVLRVLHTDSKPPSRVVNMLRVYRWLGIVLGYWPMEKGQFPPLLRGFWATVTSLLLLSSLTALLSSNALVRFDSATSGSVVVYKYDFLILEICTALSRLVYFFYLKMVIFGSARKETVRVLVDQAERASQAFLLLVVPMLLVHVGIMAEQLHTSLTSHPSSSSSSSSSSSPSSTSSALLTGLITYATSTIILWDTAPGVAVSVFGVMSQRMTVYVRTFIAGLPLLELEEAEAQFRTLFRELQHFSARWRLLLILIDADFVLFAIAKVILIVEHQPFLHGWFTVVQFIFRTFYVVVANVAAMRVTEAARDLHPALLRKFRGPAGVSFALEVKALEERGELGFHVAGLSVTKENLSRVLYLIVIGIFYMFN